MSDSDTGSASSAGAREAAGGRLVAAPEAVAPTRERRATVVARDGVMRDIYGFEHSAEADAAEAAFYAEYAMVLQQRVLVWNAYAAKKGGVKVRRRDGATGKMRKVKVVDPAKAFVRADELKRLVRGGVPQQWRAQVWLHTSGAHALRAAALPGAAYADLLAAADGMTSEAIRQIDNDLARTFPAHPSLDAVEAHAAMRRILVAYSVRNKAVGYCQSMNFLAGFMLMSLQEEDAFWLLAAVLELLLEPDFYSPSMVDSTTDQMVFGELLASICPAVAATFDEHAVPLPLISSQWFLCLFVRSVPTETTLRIWDAFFYEGSKVLFRTALAVVKTLEPAILAMVRDDGVGGGELYMRVKDMPLALLDCDALMDTAFNGLGSFPAKKIAKLRAKLKPAIAAEHAERLARRGTQPLLPGDLQPVAAAAPPLADAAPADSDSDDASSSSSSSDSGGSASATPSASSSSS